jgi:hypothetical protein
MGGGDLSLPASSLGGDAVEVLFKVDLVQCVELPPSTGRCSPDAPLSKVLRQLTLVPVHVHTMIHARAHCN